MNVGQIPADDVTLFVCLSAMTDSAAPTVPWLVRADVTKVAVVYDFIPGDLEDVYLREPAERLAYRGPLGCPEVLRRGHLHLEQYGRAVPRAVPRGSPSRVRGR